MASQEGEDWDKFEKTIQDVLSSDSGGAKRSRNEVESCESPSGSHDSSQERIRGKEPKRKKTAEVEEKEETKKGEIAKSLLFSCAACGFEAEEFKEVEEHVREDHVGEDHELVTASILVPSAQDALKTFQCGVKTCGRRFVGLKEADLKTHIGEVHGEYYIDVLKGRNIIRICRVCSGKFSSDEELTHHIRVWHARKLFANGEEAQMEESLPSTPSFSASPEVNRNVITRPEKMGKPRVREAFMDIEKRERKTSESVKDRLRLTVEKKMKENDESFKVKAKDLKYKLRKFRETYCEACQMWTTDWYWHKKSSDHRRNDKSKIRCLYCPKRLLHSNLKSHLAAEHADSSFTCNAIPYCSVSLIHVGQMVEHININHGRFVFSLIQKQGAHWEVKIPQLSRELHSLMILPSDLRRLTCRKCDLSFLSQDRSALEEHFRLDHSDLNSPQYSENIVYSCRACVGVVFGSEKHLLKHLQDSHQQSVPLVQKTPVAPKEVRSGGLAKRKAQKPKSPVDPNQEDMAQYREAIVKVINKKKSEAPRKINTLKTQKVRPTDLNHSEADDEAEDSPSQMSAPAPAANVEVSCQLCEAGLFQSRLTSHQERLHQTELFSCEGSCGRQVLSPWAEPLLQHLRRDHPDLLTSGQTGQDLLEQHLGLPRSLELVRCKGGSCEREATFLGRQLHTLQQQKTLLRHSEKKHQGQPIEDCFELGCRVCPRLWSLAEVEDWGEHCRRQHRAGKAEGEQPSQNNNQQAVETAEGAKKLFSCRISGCREDLKTFGNCWSFLDHLKAQHGYSEAAVEETRESQGCKVARHLKEVFGKEISLPQATELTKLVQHNTPVRLAVKTIIYN